MKALNLLFVLAIIMEPSVMASQTSPLRDHLPLKCQTLHKEKVFTIWPERIVFQTKKKWGFDQSRNTSSVSKIMRTIPNVQGGFDKYLRRGHHRYRIHIKNLMGPNPMDDYISIKTPKGHRISYPLNCAPSPKDQAKRV